MWLPHVITDEHPATDLTCTDNWNFSISLLIRAWVSNLHVILTLFFESVIIYWMLHCGFLFISLEDCKTEYIYVGLYYSPEHVTITGNLC